MISSADGSRECDRAGSGEVEAWRVAVQPRVVLGAVARMSNDSERYATASLFSPSSGGPYADVEINSALPMDTVVAQSMEPTKDQRAVAWRR